MEVRVKKKPKGITSDRFGFPPLEADLTDEVVRMAGMKSALEKFGRRLCRQLKIPAVKFQRITFTTIYQ